MSPHALAEVLPLPLPVDGTLFIATPVHPTTIPLRTYLKNAGIVFDEPSPELIRITLRPGLLARLCKECLASFSSLELDTTRTLLMRSGQELRMGEMLRMTTLRSLLACVKGDWLLELLRENRLTTWFQPIVPSAAPGTVFAWECLSRGLTRESLIIPPQVMFQNARDAGFAYVLDSAARVTAIFAALARGFSDATLFINFDIDTVYNTAYCLRSTFKALQDAGLDADNVVFEVVRSESIQDIDRAAAIFGSLRRRGFRISLDDLDGGFHSRLLINGLHPEFVKFAAPAAGGLEDDTFAAGSTANLLALCRERGVRSIVKDVESADDWRWLRDHGADYQQGYLFGRPAPEAQKPAMPQQITH